MRTVAVALAFCSIVQVPAPAASKWTEVRTRHFLLIGDARAGDMRDVARQFEQFHGVMRRLLPRAAATPAVPTVVVVFANERSFRPYLPLYEGKPLAAAGLFWSGRDINYVAVNAERGSDAYPTIFHELTHLIINNVLRRPPVWFSEGLAEYYSSFEMRGPNEVLLGRPIPHHTRRLLEEFLPLADLLAADHSSPLYNERSRSSVFYAQSWALVHFLRGRPETKGRWDELLRLLDRGTPHDRAFREAFGLHLPTVEKMLRNYVLQFQVPGELWKLGEAVTDTEVTAAPTDEAAALTHLARILLRMDRRADAEKRLHSALRLNPRLALAQASFAQLRLQEDRPADAWTYLAGDAPPRDFLDNYVKAAALADYVGAAGAGSQHGSTALSALRTHAAAAARQNPEVAEAWRLVAYGHLLTPDLAEAIQAMDRALALAPANEHYRFTQADILVRQHQFARARSILGELMARGRTDDIRTSARRIMASVVRFEQQVTRDDARPVPAETPPPESTGRQSIPIFREVSPGETRVFGTLTSIDCTSAGVTLVAMVEGRPIRVSVPGFNQIEFLTYRDDLTGEISCGPRNPPDSVFLTWRGAAGAVVRTTAAAVEFTPKGFTP